MLVPLPPIQKVVTFAYGVEPHVLAVTASGELYSWWESSIA